MVCLILLAVIFSVVEGLKAVTIVGFIETLFIDASQHITGVFPFTLIPKQALEISLAEMSKQTLLTVFFILFIALSVAGILARFALSLLTEKIRLKTMRSLREELYNKIISFDMDFFNEAKSGELLFMISSEVSRFSNMVIYVKNFLSASMTTLIFLIILFTLSVPSTMAIFILAAGFMVIHTHLGKYVRIKSWAANAHHAALNQMFHQIIYGIKLIRLGGLEDRERKEYLSQHTPFEQESLSVVRLNALAYAFREVFMIMTIITFSLVFFFLMQKGVVDMTSGFVLSYLFMLLKMFPQFSEFQGASISIIETLGPLERIIGILKMEKPSRQTQDGISLSSPLKIIAMRNIGFRYSSQGTDVLKDISVDFTQGKRYAVVGYSGSGKSTLLDMLVGIREPLAGEILVNGKNIKDISLKDLRDKIAYMNQEPIIFHDSVKENVCFFKKDADEHSVDRALDMAAVKDFVRGLPHGLETGIGERGLTVSGGERQRVGLARVFLKDSDVLLLDEATNALDYRTEKEIYENLKQIRGSKIIIVAAHRLSSVVDFDEIIVLNKGQVEEKGTHHQLMTRRGLYYSLYQLQELGADEA